MKKVISYLITAMMMLTMIPSIAFAGTVAEQPATDEQGTLIEQNDVQYAGSMNLHIERTNPIYSDGYVEPVVEVVDPAPDAEGIAPNASGEVINAASVEEAAAILRAKMVDRQSTVTINMPVTEADLTETALTALTSGIFNSAMNHTGKVNEGDSLQWVWQDQATDIAVSGSPNGLTATITYTIIYYTTAEQEAELTSAVEKLKDQLNLDGKSDYEKIKAIYDYMTANISYDYEHYGNNSYMLQFTAYAALVNKTSVCQGYATLFYRMACEYGIDARLVSGTSINAQGQPEGHSWNIVKLGKKYYYLDATWDSTYDSDTSKHDFFLRGTDNFTNHTLEAQFTTPEFTSAYPMSAADYVPGTSDDQGGSEEPEIPAEPEAPEVEDDTVTGFWTDYAATSFAGGNGTAADPYQIETAGQLALLAKLANEDRVEYKKANYILMQDIDLGAHEWVPIATSSTSGIILVIDGFEGTIDGNGNTISNMQIYSDQGYSYYGLVGENEGIIKNLVVENAQIKLIVDRYGWEDSTGLSDEICIGTICGTSATSDGDVATSRLENCRVNNVKIDVKSTMALCCGGIIGNLNYGQMEYSNISGKIKCQSDKALVVGGAIGRISNSAYVSCCSFDGSIYSRNVGNIENNINGYIYGHYAGGFCGSAGYANKSVEVNNCFAVVELNTVSENGLQENGLFSGTKGFVYDKGNYSNIFCKGIISANRNGHCTEEKYFWQGLGFDSYGNDVSEFKNCIVIDDYSVIVNNTINDSAISISYKITGNNYDEIFKENLNFDEDIWNIYAEDLPSFKPYVGHRWSEFITIREATCAETGLKVKKCEICGKEKTKEISQLDHEYGEVVIVSRPTNKTEGVKAYTCKACGDTKKEGIPTLAEGISEKAVVSGMCGDIQWIIYEDGLMTLYGEGEFDNTGIGSFVSDKSGNEYFAPEIEQSWKEYHHLIKKVKVKVKGCTNLAGLFFDYDSSKYPNLKEVDFTGSDTSKVKSFDCMFNSRTTLETVIMDNIGTENLYCISSMFAQCSALKSVSMEGWNLENVTNSRGMFANCSNIEEIEVPNGLSVLNSSYVYNCPNLETLIIPDSVIKVSDYAVSECKQLKTVFYYGTEETWKSISIGEDNNDLINAKIHYSYKPCKAHIYEDWTVDVEPTCEKAGTKHKECSSCGHVITESIAAYGHDLEKHEAKAATCTEVGWDVYEKCSRCDYSTYVEIPAIGHSYGDWIIDTAATCEATGSKHKKCSSCGYVITESIAALGHDLEKHDAKAETCTEVGWDAYEKCSRCDYTTYVEIPSTGHEFGEWEVTARATLSEDGVETKKCANCDEDQTKPIVKIKSISRTVATLVYNGMKKTPVAVKDADGNTLVYGVDFTVVYLTNCKNVGAHKFKVVMINKYDGEKTISFTINPKATSITKVSKPAKKQIKVTWKKQTAQVTGYQVQYSTTKNFTKKTTKTLKVKNYKTTTKTIKNLKSKKKYYIKIRTYKTVNGKPYYSAWSKAKTITTK